MTDPWAAVQERIEARTDRVLADLERRWGERETREPFAYGPRGHDSDEPPASVAEQLDVVGGIASVVVFYTDERRETVLVYNRSGGWEPPGGVIEGEATPEATARTEAREETGLDVELTDLLYTGRFEYRYASGHAVTLPLAGFVGHRVGGHLAVEREGTAHPGLTRATGLFDRETPRDPPGPRADRGPAERPAGVVGRVAPRLTGGPGGGYLRVTVEIRAEGPTLRAWNGPRDGVSSGPARPPEPRDWRAVSVAGAATAADRATGATAGAAPGDPGTAGRPRPGARPNSPTSAPASRSGSPTSTRRCCWRRSRCGVRRVSPSNGR
jgi:8-oxo-dGTP pyrophosphatase MutT (NUDIX family)